jgi:ferredoxin-NADP reductase
VLLTLPIREVRSATSRARIVRIGLDGAAFSYQAGQALLIAASGREPRRPYSIASAPEDARRDDCLELLIGVDSTGQPGPHLALEPGARVDVEGPVGRFTFPETPEERSFLFVAGGTGIAPLRAMLRHALGLPHKHIGLLYSARTPGDFAYEEELRSLAERGDIDLNQAVTRAQDSESWKGPRGRINAGQLTSLLHDSATLCFVCGPQTLVQEIPALLAQLGIRPDLIKTEEW